ncbi:MAG: LptE family protein [Gemmatimonadaceae bacterium]|nr:LptE family protein [Chitinophagaceae bacterium]
MNRFLFIGTLIFLLGAPGCFRYSLKDVSIPPEVKTIRVSYLDNKSTYINPQLSPQLTDRLRQKINNQTRLTQIQGDDAHYDITGYISGYNFTTAGISDNRSATNRLTVTVHIKVLNRLDEKKNIEADVSRSFDFDANISITQAESQLSETILKNLSDEIFNRIFSNW